MRRTHGPGSAPRSRGVPPSGWLLLLAIALLPLAPSCGGSRWAGAPGEKQRAVRVHSGPVRYAQAAAEARKWPAWWGQVPVSGPLPAVPESIPPEAKLHPALLRQLQVGAVSTRRELLVVYRDTLALPRFPALTAMVWSDSAKWATHVVAARGLVAGIRARRSADYDSIEARLLRNHGAVVRGRYWLFRAVRAEMTVLQARDVCRDPEVITIRPRFGGETPPAACDPSSPGVLDVRRALGVKGLRAAGYGDGVIALLDTGVRKDHRLLDAPLADGSDRIAGRLDFTACGDDCCEDDDASVTCCEVADEAGDVDLSGHGTASAAVLTSDAGADACDGGITEAAILSYRVYVEDSGSPDLPQLDGFATACALQAAAGLGVRVVLAEVDASPTIPDHHTEAIAEEARRAYETGCLVVAPTGNTSTVVASPALMPEVLGIGGWEIPFKSTYSGGGRGWVLRRPKPDLLGPTNYWTASNTSADGRLPYGGTSGAVASVAGAAHLLRNWLASSHDDEPGMVHAWMLASSRPKSTAGFDIGEGAGWLDLSEGGWSWWGDVFLGEGDAVKIPLSDLTWGNLVAGLPESARPGTLDDWTLEAVLWWGGMPKDLEPGTSAGSDKLTLTVVDGMGGETAATEPGSGVWRRATIRAPIAKTKWRGVGSVCGGSCRDVAALGFGDWSVRIGAPRVNGREIRAWWVVRVRPPAP